MVVINMPGGAVENIAETDLLWFRNAFASEWKGATMLRLGGDRIYSIESIGDLTEKFTASEVPLATFSAPDARMKLIVNARNVRQVTPSDPKIYHENARAVLIFSPAIKLAVRETPDDANEKLSEAKASI
jgi:hypothetical protein